MKFAILEGCRIEATPGAAGNCPGCGAQLLSKCGKQKIWHWAHKGRKHCDHWWETETDWHRSWKDNFPKECQEVASRDSNGELHIADVKMPGGYVVEFQHSAIDTTEATKRTEFHAPMIWVVNGLRRKTDVDQFRQAMNDVRSFQSNGQNKQRLHPSHVRLVREWWKQEALVAFDFGENHVWLMIAHDGEYGIGLWYKKEKLIERLLVGKQIPYLSFTRKNRRSGRVVDRFNTVKYSIVG